MINSLFTYTELSIFGAEKQLHQQRTRCEFTWYFAKIFSRMKYLKNYHRTFLSLPDKPVQKELRNSIISIPIVRSAYDVNIRNIQRLWQILRNPATWIELRKHTNQAVKREYVIWPNAKVQRWGATQKSQYAIFKTQCANNNNTILREHSHIQRHKTYTLYI